jgi:hypothetical protein
VPAALHRSGPDPPPPIRPAAAETLRLYALDRTAFETWCVATGRTALPATATTVVAFLTEAAPRLSAGGLARISQLAADNLANGWFSVG